MIAASDGSVELIGHRKTVPVTDGERLANTLGRYVMKLWSDGDLSVRWIYGDADGVPSQYGRRPEHWLWLDIRFGVRTITLPNATTTVPDLDHLVLSNSSAATMASN
jgi:hypothetical protein